MFLNLVCQTVLGLVILQAQSLSAAQPMAVYCGAELDCNHAAEGRQWREFVVPETGLYERCIGNADKLSYLPPSEVRALRYLEEPARSPVYAYPLLLGLSRQNGPEITRRVEALCVVFQDALGPPLITPYPATADVNLFDYLAELTELRHLELYSYVIDAEVFSGISKLAGLEYLGLPINCSDGHLKHLRGLTRLKFLNASDTKILGAGLGALGELPELRILDLRRNRFGAGGLGEFHSWPRLETLLLSDTNVRDEDLKTLAGLDSLEYLTLHRTAVTDEALTVLGKMSRLKYVSLYQTAVTAAGLHALSQTHRALAVDLDKPLALEAFLKERRYVHAWTGDKWAQCLVASDSVHDPVEALKWYLILAGRESEKAKLQLSKDSVNRAIERLKRQLSSRQIAEAKKRAAAYLYLHDRTTFNIQLERREGLPLYQYGFDILLETQ